VEGPYTVMASELGLQLTAELLGGLRADVAVYNDTKALIELKVFDEGKSVAAIVTDRDKMVKLSELRGTEAYIGVLVTDVSGRACADWVDLLGERLGRTFNWAGKKNRSVNDALEWCFAVAKIP
jgi:hypothetical protein